MSAYFSVLVGLVVLVVATGLALGQYHPGEICHEECEVDYCDYYYNYCEYECYEVCYPYSPEDPIRDSSPVKGKQRLQAQLPRAKPGEFKLMISKVQSSSDRTANHLS